MKNILGLLHDICNVSRNELNKINALIKQFDISRPYLKECCETRSLSDYGIVDLLLLGIEDYFETRLPANLKNRYAIEEDTDGGYRVMFYIGMDYILIRDTEHFFELSDILIKQTRNIEQLKDDIEKKIKQWGITQDRVAEYIIQAVCPFTDRIETVFTGVILADTLEHIRIKYPLEQFHHYIMLSEDKDAPITIIIKLMPQL